jgi:hypothetical protein
MREIRTLKQLEAAWDELKEEILSRPLFLDNSEKAKKERRATCENSVLEFARVYFPDYVPSEYARFHREWEKIRHIEKEPAPLAARADAARGGTRAGAAGDGRYSQARRRAAETGCAGVLAVSMGQDPRGFVHGPSRPDYVRLDDIQSRQRAKSRKFVRASIDWIMQDLIPALSDAYSLRYRGRAAQHAMRSVNVRKRNGRDKRGKDV